VLFRSDGDVGLPFSWQLEPVPIGKDEDGDQRSACVLLTVGSKTTRRASPKGHAGAALDALKYAIAETEKDPPTNRHIPRTKKVVRADTWKDYFERRSTVNSDKSDSLRRAFDRAAQKLQNDGYIGIWNGWVWII